MASSERLRKDNSGKMFIPMNVDGGIQEAGFFNSFKVAVLICMGLGTFGILAYFYDMGLGWILNIIITLIVLIIDFYLTRYCIFEERYYSKMYKKMQKYEVTTADRFWHVANLREVEGGTLLVYDDLKVGVLLKMERDTVIGKPIEYKEMHFDCLSDFYRELNLKNLSFVQISLMEPTGKDPRLNKLDEIVKKAQHNANLAKIIENQVGYTKTITRVTLFETDYIMIYTDQASRADYLIQEITECCDKLSGSSFTECKVLNKSEIIDLMCEMYDIKYFDYSQAVLQMFATESKRDSTVAFRIIGLEMPDGTLKELNTSEKNRLERVQELLDEGTITMKDWSLEEALNGKLKHVGTRNTPRFKDLVHDEETEQSYIDMDDVLFSSLIENTPTEDINTVSLKDTNNLPEQPAETGDSTGKVNDDDEIIDF